MGEAGARLRHAWIDNTAPRMVAGALIIGALAGCASPGQPKPPSLLLPERADDLSADRVGDRVVLHWMAPSETTDHLPVKGGMVAVLCRESAAAAAKSEACLEVQRLPISPGPVKAEDRLPPELGVGAPALLAYRVEIRNAAGRSAGLSGEAVTASGMAPPPVLGLAAAPIRGGVRIGWSPADGAGAVIELDRVDTARAPERPATGTSTRTPGSTARGKGPALAAAAKLPAEVRLSAGAAGEPDRGGTVDRAVEKGGTYQYRAQRVLAAVLDGHAVTLRSELSPGVTVTVLRTFPPRPPAGLEAAPGVGDTPSIDLSWQPGAETDLAGYNVYRTEAGPAADWRRVNPAVVAVPGYRDATAAAGRRYRYRVTAVDTDENESAPGNEVQEMPATR